MTLKRLVLGALTILAIVFVVSDLVNSWSQPQFNSRLELYETDLLLQASEWQGDSPDARKPLPVENPVKSALESYEKARDTAQTDIANAEAKLEKPQSKAPMVGDSATTTKQLIKQKSVLEELELRVGLLQTQQKQVNQALKTWASVKEGSDSTAITAKVLSGLWGQPPLLLPNAESQISKNLDGWFRARSLTKLYQLQQRSDALNQLQINEQQTAKQAFIRWATANAIPAIAIFSGAALLIFLIGQWAVKGKQALLAGTNDIRWSVPWDGEIVWQVLVVGFFLVGQIVLPIVSQSTLATLRINPATLGERAKATYYLVTYALLAAGGLSVLYLSIKSFLPLPDRWFHLSLKGKWFWWGLGGYLAAFPLVIVVSLVNQQIWQGRGGSNPILPIALEGKDSLAIAIFFVTAAIAAPFFEEIFFRGFLLPSLTRYFSTWQAILLSSFLFAVVHLSLSEVIPLMTLGIVLGFVYTRTQNLLASMLLHSLWNSGTLLSLFILGSGNS
jgi:membrane protease YdiL (CAAX protease family)